MIVGIKCKDCKHWNDDHCENVTLLDLDHQCIRNNFSKFEAKNKKQIIIDIPPRHMKVGWLKRLTEQAEEEKEKGDKNMEKTYVKKQVKIKAIQFTGYNEDEIKVFVGKDLTEDMCIRTLEGDMKVSVGDYVIQGVNGEFYPCKPDIFEKSYDEANANVTLFNFSKALDLLKEGKRVAREGWNGKGLFVYMVAGGDYKVQMDSVKHLADENNCLHYEPYLAIKNVKGTINTWVPSISDLMAEDWVLA